MALIPAFFDMVVQTVTGTPGTGTMTLDVAVTGFQTAAAAGIVNGTPVSYRASDGTNWETAHGTINVSGGTYTLVRGSDTLSSSNSNALVSFGSSGVTVLISPLSEDLNSLVSAHRPLIKPTTAILPTWVNQASASISDNQWGVLLQETCISTGTNHLRGRVQAFPGGDWTAIARFTRGWQSRDFIQGGLMIRESSTGKIVTMQVGGASATSRLNVTKWSDADTPGATIFAENNEPEPGVWWFKVVYVSGSTPNYSFYMSFDGYTWWPMGTMNKTTHFTTDGNQIGIWINTVTAAGTGGIDYLGCSSWEIG